MGWNKQGTITGATGAPGAPGVGSAGIQGPGGPAGAAGGVWHVGPTAPATSIGADGDMYYDTVGIQVYHKVGGVWHALGSIKGSAGAGISIVSTVDASALPAALGAGDAGNGYIIATGGTNFGTLWVSGHLAVWDGSAFTDAGEIQGPPGIAGPPGAAGVGTVGATGAVPTFSVDATPVAVGSPPTIVAGTAANSYVLGLPQGATGGPGAAGSDGTSVKGDPGGTGPIGVRGSVWRSGPADPVGAATDLPGDMYMNTTTGDVFQLA